ncbi:hypothetical protein C6P45_005098 [Maudiozyma exigua]|uniref:t-SNARE coiled-coil homology domain-containing protein n=1 Tax=Maudiozyma exigua TaxID=34358 RepID=A0A9P7BAP4_MAUEX|nr:hypothetical protein C6P45_005098 [Kazachstania exigua]
MDVLKLVYEIDRLEDLIEERNRLVNIVKILPSSADNDKLKEQLSTIYDLLNELYEQSISSKLSQTDIDTIRESLVRYQKAIRGLEEEKEEQDQSSLDVADYKFHKKFEQVEQQHKGAETPIEVKRVRFSDNTESQTVSSNKDGPIKASDMHFKPYFDDDEEEEEEEERNNSANDISVDNNANITNRELFIEQQQRLMNQDQHIDTLAASVSRAHGMSLDINQEVETQNTGLLADLENMVDTSDRNLQRARRRLDTFQRTARENGPCTTIVLLLIILILLLVVL